MLVHITEPLRTVEDNARLSVKRGPWTLFSGHDGQQLICVGALVTQPTIAQISYPGNDIHAGVGSVLLEGIYPSRLESRVVTFPF